MRASLIVFSFCMAASLGQGAAVGEPRKNPKTPSLTAKFTQTAAPGVAGETGPAVNRNEVPGLGERLTSGGGEIRMTVLKGGVAEPSDIYVFRKGVAERLCAKDENNRTLSFQVPAGDVDLAIKVVQRGRVYHVGPGSLNPDGVAHASVRRSGSGGVEVRFEDEWKNTPVQKSIADDASPRTTFLVRKFWFNDVVLQFSGDISTTSSAAVENQGSADPVSNDMLTAIKELSGPARQEAIAELRRYDGGAVALIGAPGANKVPGTDEAVADLLKVIREETGPVRNQAVAALKKLDPKAAAAEGLR